MLYLDGRMRPDLFATAAEQDARARHLAAGAPLRLIHSGRLEPLKGAQDLVPLAAELARRGVAFTLDIYGTGSLAPAIRTAAAEAGLADRLRLHDPVDFETALVPRARRAADLFVSLHRQSDPSCSYLESMGCGLPVAGYANRMLTALVAEAGAGWTVPMGDWRALAARIAALDADRPALVAQGAATLAFARRHDFGSEFARRTAHLQTLLDQPAAA